MYLSNLVVVPRVSKIERFHCTLIELCMRYRTTGVHKTQIANTVLPYTTSLICRPQIFKTLHNSRHIFYLVVTNIYHKYCVHVCLKESPQPATS